ncbi:MAG: SLC13 family permease [Thermodesulfobacteriota bacterium]
MKRKFTLQRIGFFLGPILFLTILQLKLEPGSPEVTKMAAIAVLMSVWWITDAIPLYATALLPIVLYPLLGISNANDIAPVYFNSVISLFIGGFLIALSMEKWNLHKRIALFIIKTIGSNPSTIILGFMIASAFLSMWISNTATSIMMLPIGLAVVSGIESISGKENTRNFAVSLLIGIAYSCSIGGIATLIGTPPNLSFSRIFEITFPGANPISFGSWFMMGLPLSAVLLLASWLVLTKIVFPSKTEIKYNRSVVKNEYKNLGRMTFEEKVVFLVFIFTAFLWISRQELNIGALKIPGWSSFIPNPGFIDDSTVAVFMAFLLFLIPSRSKNSGSNKILDADVIKKLPWDIIILFGGGFALAKGFQVSGLSFFIGSKFEALVGINPLIIILLTCLFITFLTELTSNTATTEMVLPILASVSVVMKINPLLIMIPATVSASCAFMMPVATPPNAVVFGSGRIKISDMAKSGFILSILGVFIVTLFFYYIGSKIFLIDVNSFPDWASTGK